MTTCCIHNLTTHVRDNKPPQSAIAPSFDSTVAVRSKKLLRLLTGVDSVKLPHHPRRRRSRRF